MWLMVVTTTACGAGASGREGSVHAATGDTRELHVAAADVLLTALLVPESADAAVQELAMAGAASTEWITVALARDRTTEAGQHLGDATRAALLEQLADRGNDDAITELQDTTSTDPIVIAWRTRQLDTDTQRSQLLAALEHAASRVRLAATRVLANATQDATTTLALTQRARLDPDASVRAAALEALAKQHDAAFEVIAAQLEDRDALVRSVAMRELAKIDCARAETTLAPLLSGAASEGGLAAVRALSGCDAATIERHIEHLRRALASTNVTLRLDAAATANAVAWLQVPEWIATPLAHDPVAAVRLALAIALQTTQRDAALSTFRELARNDVSMVSLQAATSVATAEHASEADAEAAVATLRAGRVQRDALLRRVAFRALGRLSGRLADLEAGLYDEDTSVRLAAAGALLRASHQSL